MNKEVVLLNGFKQLIGLRFKRREDCIEKVFVFQFKKPKSWIDIDTLFMKFPIRVTLWLDGGVVSSFVMKPYSLKICNLVFDKITEEVI